MLYMYPVMPMLFLFLRYNCCKKQILTMLTWCLKNHALQLIIVITVSKHCVIVQTLRHCPNIASPLKPESIFLSYTHAHTHTHTHTLKNTLSYTPTHLLTLSHTHTHLLTHTHTCTHAHTPPHPQTHSHTYRTHTHTLTHTHTPPWRLWEVYLRKFLAVGLSLWKNKLFCLGLFQAGGNYKDCNDRGWVVQRDWPRMNHRCLIA